MELTLGKRVWVFCISDQENKHLNGRHLRIENVYEEEHQICVDDADHDDYTWIHATDCWPEKVGVCSF